MPTLLPEPRALPVRPFNGINFIVTSYISGAAMGLAFTLAILALDVGGLTSLIASDSSSWLAAALLAAGMSLTFASLYTAAAIMLNFRGATSLDNPRTGNDL